MLLKLVDLEDLIDTYISLIRKQNELIDALKEVNNALRVIHGLPSQIITSPPTPFRVETCETRAEGGEAQEG